MITEYGKGYFSSSSETFFLLPESCTKYRSEAPKALFLRRSWSDFAQQAYYLYGEDQNHETSFIVNALQAAVDNWRKIQVMDSKPQQSLSETIPH